MSRVEQVIKELSARLEFVLHKTPIVLNEIPPVMDEKNIYIIVPEGESIEVDMMISSESWISYDINIFEIAHVQNMNRQGIVRENIYESLEGSSKLYSEVIPRKNLLTNVCGAVCYKVNYGTSTWVTDTKVYSAYKMTLYYKDVLEDNPKD